MIKAYNGIILFLKNGPPNSLFSRGDLQTNWTITIGRSVSWQMKKTLGLSMIQSFDGLFNWLVLCLNSKLKLKRTITFYHKSISPSSLSSAFASAAPFSSSILSSSLTSSSLSPHSSEQNHFPRRKAPYVLRNFCGFPLIFLQPMSLPTSPSSFS